MKPLIEFKKSLKSTLLGVCALAALGAGSAQAAPLNLTMPDSPDIASGFIDVIYDAGSDTLTADGFADNLEYNSANYKITDSSLADDSFGIFDLDANIDGSGILVGGTLTISGYINALGFNSGTLLTGTLTDFGFLETGGDPLEFVFDVTGGDAAGLYGGTGGIILTASGFAGSFAGDWDNLSGGISGTGSGAADVGVVPLPAAFWLFGSALLGFVGFARRKRS